MAGVVFAAYTTWISPTVQIVEGEAWRDDDPVVKAHRSKFQTQPKIVRTTLPRHLRQPVEQATAAPGELRVVKPRVDQAGEEVEQLRADLAALEVAVDGRWGLARLREELAKAQAGE